ncbi:unnamed protein product [Ixodes persulcatus]
MRRGKQKQNGRGACEEDNSVVKTTYLSSLGHTRATRKQTSQERRNRACSVQCHLILANKRDKPAGIVCYTRHWAHCQPFCSSWAATSSQPPKGNLSNIRLKRRPT